MCQQQINTHTHMMMFLLFFFHRIFCEWVNISNYTYWDAYLEKWRKQFYLILFETTHWKCMFEYGKTIKKTWIITTTISEFRETGMKLRLMIINKNNFLCVCILVSYNIEKYVVIIMKMKHFRLKWSVVVS